MTAARPWTFASMLVLTACGGGVHTNGAAQTPSTATPGDDGGTTYADSQPFAMREVATLNAPWALDILPGTATALVTQKAGSLVLVDLATGAKRDVLGAPKVDFGGQGGLGDVLFGIDPDPADKRYPVYLSWAEAGDGDTRGAVVGLGTLVMDGATPRVDDLKVIWRQSDKVTGRGHYGHRLAFSPDRQYLFITSGDRQKMTPAQNLNSSLGKIIRLRPDGSVPADNPFAAKGGVATTVWSYGHRNPLGIAFDSAGRLWNSEMGPAHGDEVNLVKPGANYGWPNASNGSHYDGRDIPDHNGKDGFEAPRAWWNPGIAPASLAYYNADLFPAWKNSLFVTALAGESLIRLKIDGDRLVKADHWNLEARIRAVDVAPDGGLLLLGDGKDAKLWHLTPKG